MLQMVPLKNLWLYGEYQSTYSELSQIVPNITFVEGVPENLNKYVDSKYRNLIVIDDLTS